MNRLNRRTLLTRALALAGAAVVAPSVAAAEASEQACADCARLFDRDFVLPAMYAKPNPEIMALARDATHAMATRERISHDEAGLAIMLWHGFPPYHAEPLPEVEDARAEGYLRGLDVGRAGAESRAFADHPYNRAWLDAPDEGHCTECRLSADHHPTTFMVAPGRIYPLTFEAMQADCAARGCSLGLLVRAALPWGILAVRHGDAPRYEEMAMDRPGTARLDGDDLARVVAWRRSLHDA